MKGIIINRYNTSLFYTFSGILLISILITLWSVRVVSFLKFEALE